MSEYKPETDKVIVFADTAGFKGYEKYFPSEAVAHPAKANISMLQWIIERYTKPNDLILDPLAGTFSTCVVAGLNGRNAVGVEYEEKFYQWGLKAKQLFDEAETLTPKGKITVLKGDARRLTEVLQENADAIIFSPPYAIDPKNICHTKDGKRLQDYDRARGFKETQPYSDDPANIGNLQHGCVDAIVMSPPYENAMEGGSRHHPESEPHYRFVREKHLWNYYSDDKIGQLGNLKGETYLSAMLQVYRECFRVLREGGYCVIITKNFIRRKKVVRLDLDTIKLCEHAGFHVMERWYRKLTSFSFWVLNYYRKYGLRVEYEDLLVFRKEGVMLDGAGVDAIITSPPYGIHETSQESSKREIEYRLSKGIRGAVKTEAGKYMTGQGKRGQTYSDDPANIGNLPYR